MQVLDGRELLISATTEGASFFRRLSSPGNSEKLRSGLLVIFAHRNGTKLHIRLTVTPILLSK